MSFVEDLHAAHKARLSRIALAAARQQQKPAPASYSIPNTPFGVAKVDTSAPPQVPEDWVQRQKRIHRKAPWFEIVDGPREFDLPKRKYRTIEDVQRAVCKHYDMTLHEMISARRTKDIVLVRSVAMHLCRRLTPRSYPEIGKRFGGRDHTTAIHADRQMIKRQATDHELQEDINFLIKKLGGEP